MKSRTDPLDYVAHFTKGADVYGNIEPGMATM